MTETRACQNCKKDFVIETADFNFYKKIDVPSPTFCPECRLRNRLQFYNERSLYRRSCGLCGKESLSCHRPDAPHPNYCEPCWWSDAWDPMKYGLAYDFSRSFFDQFRQLRDSFPLPLLNNIYTSNVGSDYCNMTSYVKNSYLLFTSDFTEDSAFSCYLERSRQCYDTDHSDLSELCYDSIGLYKCHNVKYSSDLIECVDVVFSRDLRNCSNCFGCINLRSKQYCIFNEQKTKEEYFDEIKKYDLRSLKVVRDMKEKAAAFFLTQPHKYMTGVGSTGISGDYISWSKNVTRSYEVAGGEDCKYCCFFPIKGAKNCLDVSMWGGQLIEGYESCAIGGGQNNIKFSFECWGEASNLTYCSRILAPNSDLFGCIGLRNKKYCILNREYSKKTYEELVQKIITQMRAAGEWGSFFPADLSLFGYNESIANKYMPLSKEDALQKGYKWNEVEKKNHQGGADIIGCVHAGKCDHQCFTAFRLIPAEIEFYKAQQIPIPQLCSICRHYERLKNRNPINLWHRQCMRNGCKNEFETSYAPDRPEIVYCESCYNAEVV